MGFLGIKSAKEKDRETAEKIAKMQMISGVIQGANPLNAINSGSSTAAARTGGEMGGVTSLHPDSKDLKKKKR